MAQNRILGGLANDPSAAAIIGAPLDAHIAQGSPPIHNTFTDVVQDTSPQLGGDLDVNDFSIVAKPAATATSDGNDMIITSSDGGATSGDAGWIKLLAGTHVANTGQYGGSIDIVAGNSTGTGGYGGWMFLRGGDAGTVKGGLVEVRGAYASAEGGTVHIAAGQSPTGKGGDVSARGGNSNSAPGGAIDFRAGGGVGDTGGEVVFASGGGNVGGNINLTSGQGIAGDGGAINITAGDSTSASDFGGAIDIQAGGGGATGYGGDVGIYAGNSSSYYGGRVLISGGGALDPSTGYGGDVVIGGGSTSGTGDGGNLFLNGGIHSHGVTASTADAGHVNIRGGIVQGTLATGLGGNVNLIPGRNQFFPANAGNIALHAPHSNTGQSSLQFWNDADIAHTTGNYVALKAPVFVGSPPANITFVLPEFDGANGEVMTTDGSGNLSFAASAGGGIASVVEDTTPELGGHLDSGGFNISGSDFGTGYGGGGDLNIKGGQAGTTGGDAGNVVIEGGTGGTFSGDVRIHGGIRGAIEGGEVFCKAPSGLVGGTVNITGGFGQSSSAEGGAVNVTGGRGGTNGATTDGGDLKLSGGAGQVGGIDGKVIIPSVNGNAGTLYLAEDSAGAPIGLVGLRAESVIATDVVWTIPAAQQSFGDPLGIDLGEYVIASLPAAATYPNCWALATNASGGSTRTIVRSDGTNWKVVATEGATVA